MKEWREEMEAGEGRVNGEDYERRARRNGEKRWKQEKGPENGEDYMEGGHEGMERRD
jgi:hypothetical protein